MAWNTLHPSPESVSIQVLTGKRTMSDTPELELPKRTTPTWDMELLISGATVFGLLQLTGTVEGWSIWAISQNEMAVQQALVTLFLYVQFSVLVLAATFVLHLLMRGYWVALVGLNSVYPDGIRWDQFRLRAPIGTEIGEKHAVPIPDLIERADNRATWVFGVGFAVALMMVGPAVIVGFLALLLLVAQHQDWPMDLISTVYWWTLAGIGLPLILATWLDATIGKRIQATAIGTVIRYVLGFYQRIGLGRNQNPLLAIAVSHMPTRWAMAGISLLIAVVMMIVATGIVMRASVFDNGAFDGLPKRTAYADHLLFDGHYADRRNQDGVVISPFIQSPLVRGNTLRLFAPYRPRNLNAAMQAQCPEALTETARNKGEGLSCLARMLEPKLDGAPLPLTLIAATDPISQQRGAIAFIDIRNLSVGQHELLLRRLPVDPEQPEAETWHRIEFWRE